MAALSHFNRQAVREFPVSYRNPESLSPTPKDPMQSPKFNNVTYSRLHWPVLTVANNQREDIVNNYVYNYKYPIIFVLILILLGLSAYAHNFSNNIVPALAVKLAIHPLLVFDNKILEDHTWVNCVYVTFMKAVYSLPCTSTK